MNRVALCYRKAENAKPYSDALRAVGLEPILISPDTPLDSLDTVEGLLLSGGSDLNPKRYGATLHPATGPVDDARDELELRLVTEAVEKSIPALCICRGMQILNVALGGTLQQDIPNHRVRNESDPGKPVHGVAVRTETLLSSIVGAALIEVNSRHHQAVDRLGPRLAVSGVAPDGIIEAIEVRSGGFLLGVQWHPENQVDQGAHRFIFEKFATAVRRSD